MKFLLKGFLVSCFFGLVCAGLINATSGPGDHFNLTGKDFIGIGLVSAVMFILYSFYFFSIRDQERLNSEKEGKSE